MLPERRGTKIAGFSNTLIGMTSSSVEAGTMFDQGRIEVPQRTVEGSSFSLSGERVIAPTFSGFEYNLLGVWSILSTPVVVGQIGQQPPIWPQEMRKRNVSESEIHNLLLRGYGKLEPGSVARQVSKVVKAKKFIGANEISGSTTLDGSSFDLSLEKHFPKNLRCRLLVRVE